MKRNLLTLVPTALLALLLILPATESQLLGQVDSKAKSEQQADGNKDKSSSTGEQKSEKPEDGKTKVAGSAKAKQDEAKSGETGESNKKEPKPERTTRRSRTSTNSKRSSEFTQLFADVTASASASTVKIFSGKREIALGAVVDSNGLIVTKASELRGKVVCKLPDGTQVDATVFGLDKDSDLALLKVPAENLPQVNWSNDPPPVMGQWIASPDGAGGALNVGVISVNVRKIPPGGGFLGIMPAPPTEGSGVRVDSVTSNQPADKAGVRVNDVIIKIDDIEITDILKLRETLRNYSEGDQILLTVRRGDEEIEMKLRLNDYRKANAQQFQRSASQNRMGSTLSRRRLDFPLAFQHDSQLQANECGGPIVDLNGSVVGLNIARAGRVKTLALPASEVQRVVTMLKSGEFQPAVVNKERIFEIEKEIAELAENAEKFPEKKLELNQDVAEAKAREKEIERMIADLNKRLKEIEEEKSNSLAELKKMESKYDSVDVEKERLERELEALKTGIRK